MNSVYANFSKLPHGVFDLGLSVHEGMVLVYLISLSNNEEIYPSKETIASKTGLSRRTVDKAVRGLVKRKFLEYKKGFISGRTKVCNRYNILLKNIDPTCVIKRDGRTDFEEDHIRECDEIIKNCIETRNA
jgi:DNA-binding transcriptional regulator YhcF (GntR family)